MNKRTKRKKCFARTRLPASGRMDKHGEGFSGPYFEVFLWEDQEGLSEATGHGNDTFGCVSFSPVVSRMTRRIGEIHLIRGRWDLEIVAHEVFHASFNASRYMEDPGHQIRSCLDKFFVNDAEERLAYRHGRMCDLLYGWLWMVDVNPNWKRVSGEQEEGRSRLAEGRPETGGPVEGSGSAAVEGGGRENQGENRRGQGQARGSAAVLRRGQGGEQKDKG